MRCSICHRDVRTYTIRNNKVICMECFLKEREKERKNKENNALHRASFIRLDKQGNILNIKQNMLLDNYQLKIWEKKILSTDWICVKYESRNSPSDEWHEMDMFGGVKVVKDFPINKLSINNLRSGCSICPARQVCKVGKKNAGA